ncbi:MAG TPA: DUF1501 domain-containing protein [Blastocatellia bacterium]|nr:DUF1501 domain-containing protein [Blastocatellia bacterium]
MAINRRQFIKRSAGAVSVSLIMPRFWMGNVAQGQEIAADPNRKIFVVIQLAGGNDGLNTVVPYTDSRYQTLRPTIGFKDTELKDDTGASTILGSTSFGFNPAMGELKSLYDAGKVGVVLGVSYANPNLSHFFATDIWSTANTTGAGNGWLGRYADQKLFGKSGLSAVSIGSSLPKALYADKIVVPNITPAGGADPFVNYAFQTDARNAGDKNNQLNTFKSNNTRTFPTGSFDAALAEAGFGAEEGAAQLRTAVQGYTPGATYPTNNQPSATAVSFASALKMVAEIITTIPDANLLYVQLGGFDHHSQEIGTATDNFHDKTKGQHATLLKALSLGVKTFYDDLTAHGIADNVVMMTWSEFGRRPNENASIGTDHGTTEPIIVIGNAVHGGIYGEQPSLSDLDSAGNMKVKVDFRSVYSTILDKWLGADSQSILGAKYDNVGFLG